MPNNQTEQNAPSCVRLTPIDKEKLQALANEGKKNPHVIKTLKCKTVAEGRFRHLNYIRTLPPYIVDEPPTLLGDDTAPNPSEALLAALGSCIAVGIHANAVAQDKSISKLEVQLEGDLNITAVWGTGDLDENKPLGFTDVRIVVTLEGDFSQEEREKLIKHALKWSPVANTLMRKVNVTIA
ncbi:OsmC family peroxiredoxin [Helicobacter aurati]|uniref:OsmC family peroxiredoxin n=1 Tax=Helicobacter aurati TaxID=137778 RepID=A0A3D8IYI0_9HELI|nr:OsmC family protein [Helicobacter aurati]RDU70322.1 OsmC family peroxiredoxin [Helicobacter aurati]